MIYAIGSEDLIEWWPHARPYIESALPYANGKYDIDWVYKTVAADEGILWVSDNSAAFTQIYDYPNYRTLCVLFSGGDLVEHEKHIRVIEDFARQAGCRNVEIPGRRGWGRVLGKQGYEEYITVSSKEL